MSVIPVENPFFEADVIGVRLELIGGAPVWEPSLSCRHQFEIDRIRSSFVPNAIHSEMHSISSVYFRFRDGSLKRPDIAVLCRVPREDEMDAALEIVPEAVIEIISEGYEDKDLRLAPGFYLVQGVKDVLIFDPRAKIVWHHRADGVQRHYSAHQFALKCGGICTV